MVGLHVQHVTDGTDLNDPPRKVAKITTTSNDPNPMGPLLGMKIVITDLGVGADKYDFYDDSDYRWPPPYNCRQRTIDHDAGEINHQPHRKSPVSTDAYVQWESYRLQGGIHHAGW